MARNKDSGRLRVMLWGREIGQLCWNPAKGNSYFFFSPEYLSSGLDIAPLTASSKSPAARFAIYGNTDSASFPLSLQTHFRTIGATPSLTSGSPSTIISRRTRLLWRNFLSSGAVPWVRSNSSPAARMPSVRMRG